MIEAYKCLKKELIKTKEKVVVVAVSGGPDSMALLHFLVRLKKELGLSIICAHVHHNLRKESDEEKVFVESFCKDYNICFEWMKIDEYGDENFHKEAREIRYAFFESLLKKYHSHLLLTAHHGDDLMETILMRMVRGTTLKGYSGFEFRTHYSTYTLMRPFITLTKKDILEYNVENQIEYVIDSSNEKDKYTRNRYRKYILPVLKKEYESVHTKFYKFSETILEASLYIDKVATLKKEEICTGNSFRIEMFLKEDIIIQKRILELLLEDIYRENIFLITDKIMESILSLLTSKCGNKRISLPNGFEAVQSYEIFSIEKRKEVEEYDIEITRETSLPNGSQICILDSSTQTDNFICRLSTDDVSFPLRVRTHKNGDKMEVKNLSGHKKISSIFKDEKLSLKERKRQPIVVDNTEKIVWIPGLKKSQFDRTKEEKYDIILKYYELKGENNE